MIKKVSRILLNLLIVSALPLKVFATTNSAPANLATNSPPVITQTTPAADQAPPAVYTVTNHGPLSFQLKGSTQFILAQPRQADVTNGKSGGPLANIGLANIRFIATGKTENDYQYRAVSVLETAPGGGSGGVYFSQNFIEGATPYGIFQFGNLNGPIETMIVDAFDLMGGSGGANGIFTNIVNFAEGMINGVDAYGIPGKASKIVYYSPEFGTQDTRWIMFGLAYTPNTAVRGKDAMDYNRSSSNLYANEPGIYPNKAGAAFGLNNVNAVVQVGSNFSGHKFTFALGLIMEKSRRGGDNWPGSDYDSGLEFFKFKNVRNANSWQTGLSYNYQDLTVSAGYINNKKSRLPFTVGYDAGNAGQSWNMGAKLVVGDYTYSLAYVETQRKLPDLPANTANVPNCKVLQKARSKILSAAVDKTILPGLAVFGELNFFSMKTDPSFAKFMGTTASYKSKNIIPTVRNSGYTWVVGLKASF